MSKICQRLYFQNDRSAVPPCPPLLPGYICVRAVSMRVHGGYMRLGCVMDAHWTQVCPVEGWGRVLLGVSGLYFCGVPLWHAGGTYVLLGRHARHIDTRACHDDMKSTIAPRSDPGATFGPGRSTGQHRGSHGMPPISHDFRGFSETRGDAVRLR